jgi:hypothetical protein
VALLRSRNLRRAPATYLSYIRIACKNLSLYVSVSLLCVSSGQVRIWWRPGHAGDQQRSRRPVGLFVLAADVGACADRRRNADPVPHGDLLRRLEKLLVRVR